MFKRFLLGNYSYNSYFGNVTSEISPVDESNIDTLNFIINNNIDSTCAVFVSVNREVNTNYWLLYFDGSKSVEGEGVGCILYNPQGMKLFTMQIRF